MHIAYTFYDRPKYTAGPRINALRLLPELKRRGHEVTAIVGYWGACPAKETLERHGITVHAIPWATYCEDLVAMLQAALLESDPDVYVANMMQIPLADNSIDLVITNHSLEPNGGNEKVAITELSRVANKFLLMNEPSYEFGDDKAKQRIDQHGYVKFLGTHAADLGLNVIRNEAFGLSLNPLNPTGNTIVQIHDSNCESATPAFQCPISGLPLTKQDDSMWGSGGYAFPIVGGIPCMLQENAILASHFQTEPGRG